MVGNEVKTPKQRFEAASSTITACDPGAVPRKNPSVLKRYADLRPEPAAPMCRQRGVAGYEDDKLDMEGYAEQGP